MLPFAASGRKQTAPSDNGFTWPQFIAETISCRRRAGEIRTRGDRLAPPLVDLRQGRRDPRRVRRVARERSEAVRAYLVQAGVDPTRIRATWQPVGDNAADNASDGGRRLNRRVEIELYRVAPRFASLVSTPDL